MTVTYTVEAPDGHTYKITGPVGVKNEEVIKVLLSQNPAAGILKKDGEKPEVMKQLSMADLEALAANNIAGVSAYGLYQLQGWKVVPASQATALAPAAPPVPDKLQVGTEAALILAAFLLLQVVIPWLGARTLNRKHLALRPASLPFAWGYYLALSGLVMSVAMAVIGVIRYEKMETAEAITLIAVIPLIFVPLSILCLRRHRTGFVLLTVMTINPLLWIANGIYIKNRWREMSSTVNVPKDYFGEALSEIESGKKDLGLWAQLLSESDGDEGKTRARYIKQRARQLLEDRKEATADLK